MQPRTPAQHPTSTVIRRKVTAVSTLVVGFFVLIAVAISPAIAQKQLSDAELWQALSRGQALAFMRHALAPGGGDPDNFALGECTTQRNLSDAGRAQARATGEVMRKMGLKNVRLYTSQWCRCRETAQLLGFGEPAEMPALNSLFSRPQNREPQVAAVKRFIADMPGDAPPHVMVSHQVTIRALTGQSTGSGAIAVVKGDGKGGVTFLGIIQALPAR